MPNFSLIGERSGYASAQIDLTFPQIFVFFPVCSKQEQQDALTMVKFCMDVHTIRSLSHAEFPA